MLPRERVAFEAQVPFGLQIDADPDQLYRVLNNLLRNAAEAIEGQQGEAAPGKVSVVARRSRAAVEIEVSDTGPGVPLQARENLFAPFKAAVRKGGTGLGLAIAAELMRALGGDIALVDSGRGATFRVTVPDRQQ